MSRDPDQQQPLSSSATSSSAITSSSSTAPRIQSSGVPSFANDHSSHSPLGDRLRLPPLSSLISSSTSAQPHSSPSPVSSPHAAFYPHQDWSPSKSNASTSIDSQTFPHHTSERGDVPYSKSDRFLSVGKGQMAASYDAGSSRHSGNSPILRRSNSSTSTSTTASILNLPPLNALHIRHSSQTPSEVSSHVAEREWPPPPMLPIHSSSSSTRNRSGATSSSYTESGVGPIRKRYTGEATLATPYTRPSPPSDAEYFNHVWEIYSYACRVNDDAAGSMRHTYPAIGHSDVKMLLYHFNRELERLDQYNPRLSNQLAQDACLFSGSNRSSRHSPLSSPSTSTSSQLQSQGWMNVPRRTAGMDRLSPHREVSYHHSEYPVHRRGSHGESHSSGASVTYTTPGQPYRSLQASPRLMHPYQHHSYQHNPYATEGPPPFSSMNYNSSTSSSIPPKRVRKRKDEAEQSCLSCSATETPEWRKGPTGPRTLCNACGLLFAKQCRKRELDAQARGERPKGSRPMAIEIMSVEEKEKSLNDLRIAVNARAANGSPPI